MGDRRREKRSKENQCGRIGCVEPGMSLVGFTDILFVLGELNAFFSSF